jgi:hypothetical protein
VEREPEGAVPRASAAADGAAPREQVRGGAWEERREQDRGKGAERGRRRGKARGGAEAGGERGGGWGGVARAGAEDVEREMALRGCLEEAHEREKGVAAEGGRQGEAAVVVAGGEELLGGVVAGGSSGGRRSR